MEFLSRSVAIGCALTLGATSVWSNPASPAPANRDQILHVLDRTTFGPRPGDIAAVERIGVQKYIEQQLHPETIDDAAVDKQIAQFPLLKLSETELAQFYYSGRELSVIRRHLGAELRRVQKDGADEQAMGEVRSEYRQKMDNLLAQGNLAQLFKQFGGSIPVITELQHAKLIRAANSNRQLQEVLVDFWGNHFNIDVKKGPCSVFKVADDQQVIRANVLGNFRDMLEASAKSPAMLFYLDNAKNTAPATAGDLAPGKRKRKPAAPEAVLGQGDQTMVATENKPRPPKAKQLAGRGINENYAREIMELHTLGVDGGYTQKDVQEVARCFTGWGIDRDSGEFIFHPSLHDNGEKTVLGHSIPAGGGIKDGEMVLDILSTNPATAKFISRKLCQRFVADNPPQQLIDRVAGVFLKTHGDLRAVTGAILTSPEFMDPSTYRNKIKSPEEFAISAVRAAGITLTDDTLNVKRTNIALEAQAVQGRAAAADRMAAMTAQPLNWHVYQLGQPLFACTPPTGYKEVSSTWVSPGALIARLNFAMALTGQKVPDAPFSAKTILNGADLDNPDAVLNQCITSLLNGKVSDGTRKVLAEATLPAKGSSSTVDPNKLIALIIGSPEFQRK